MPASDLMNLIMYSFGWRYVFMIRGGVEGVLVCSIAVLFKKICFMFVYYVLRSRLSTPELCLLDFIYFK